MKNLLWVGLCFVAMFTKTYAQIDYPDASIVTTKKGMRYVGIVTEQPRQLDIKLIDGNEVSVFVEDINRYLPAADINVYKDGTYHMIDGWFSMIGQGLSLAGGENGESVSSILDLTFGRYLTPRYAVGLGIGINRNDKELDDITINTASVPLFAYGRYDITRGRRKLFAYGRLGYGFDASGDPDNPDINNGGVHAGLGLGILFANSKKVKWFIKLGYFTQGNKGSQSFLDDFGNEVITNYDLQFNRIAFTFGFDVNRKK